MDRLLKKFSSFAFKIGFFFYSFELRKCPVTKGTGKLNHSPATLLLLKLQKLRIKYVRSNYDTCVVTVVIFAVYAMLEKIRLYSFSIWLRDNTKISPSDQMLSCEYCT